MSGLEWITRDSCCASANFLGQLNGLSIPRTRSLNNKWYENVSGRKIDYYYYYYFLYLSICLSVYLSIYLFPVTVYLQLSLTIKENIFNCILQLWDIPYDSKHLTLAQ